MALPAFACPDLISAASASGARIVPYVLDPHTPEPDPDSFLGALGLRCTHFVVTHQYGRVVDLSQWTQLANDYDAVSTEDAAQHEGATCGGLVV